MLSRIHTFLAEKNPMTPCLVIDLSTVEQSFLRICTVFSESRTFYAVKANPSREVIETLVTHGANFEVASLAELELCLRAGASAENIAFTNPIKKRRDVENAFKLGVRRFTTDSFVDVENIAELAPGSQVMCRLAVSSEGAKSPLGAKFGCSTVMAVDILRRAAQRGLLPIGVAFHPGSQQLNPHAWEPGIAQAAEVFSALSAVGIHMDIVNLGGGFPVRYTEPIPTLEEYANAISAALRKHFVVMPQLEIEPGRAVVADAGVIVSEVVLVTKKSVVDEHRWVYLDVGRYNGLAETECEMITYQLWTDRQGSTGRVILAGPTCDGDDVIYQRTHYELPLNLSQGDEVWFLSAGAYTASFASVFFNGFTPMVTYCLPSG